MMTDWVSEYHAQQRGMSMEEALLHATGRADASDAFAYTTGSSVKVYKDGALVPQKPQTRAELQAHADRVNRQVIADLQQYASVLCGMPLPVGSAIESATEGLPPKPYPPGPYPPPAPPPLAAHRMVSVKDDHAVHGPDGLRIFAGRGHKGKWRAEIIAAALDGRWADAQWAKGVIDE